MNPKQTKEYNQALDDYVTIAKRAIKTSKKQALFNLNKRLTTYTKKLNNLSRIVPALLTEKEVSSIERITDLVKKLKTHKKILTDSKLSIGQAVNVKGIPAIIGDKYLDDGELYVHCHTPYHAMHVHHTDCIPYTDLTEALYG